MDDPARKPEAPDQLFSTLNEIRSVQWGVVIQSTKVKTLPIFLVEDCEPELYTFNQQQPLYEQCVEAAKAANMFMTS